MATFHLRPATRQDANAIADVHMASRRDAMPYLPELHSAAEIRARVAHVVLEQQVVWVAESKGRVVGVAALTEGELKQLYILPGEQGRGIGSALLEMAKDLSPGGLSLWTFQQNVAARSFYEHRGFVAVEFEDGSGNEEGEPDVRYQWIPTAERMT